MSLSSISTAIAAALLLVVQLLQTIFEQVHALPDARGVERMVHQTLKDIERLTMELCIQDKGQQAQWSNVQEVRCLHCEHGWAALLEAAAPRYTETRRARSRPWTAPRRYCRLGWATSGRSDPRPRCSPPWTWPAARRSRTAKDVIATRNFWPFGSRSRPTCQRIWTGIWWWTITPRTNTRRSNAS